MSAGQKLDDAEFRRRIDDAMARRNLSAILGRHTKLKRRGRELVGLCPYHQEKSPSFEVNDAKGVYYCHGCGASGDHFTALKLLDRLTFREAYEALTNDTFPTVSDGDRVKALREDAAARASAIDDARLMWARSVDPHGTPAELYLRTARGISMELPLSVRFGMVPTSRDDDGHWKKPYPAVVLACTDAAGDLIGVQRIFLRDDGSDKRWGKRSKLSAGRPRGGVVRFSGGPSPVHVVTGEGPEDGLSLAQELPDRAVWAALGTAMIPEIQFPQSVRRVTIAGQNDAPGRAAAAKAVPLLEQRGFDVDTMWPGDAFKDWNDQLRGVRM